MKHTQVIDPFQFCRHSFSACTAHWQNLLPKRVSPRVPGEGRMKRRYRKGHLFILVACEGLKRDFVPTNKLELVDPRSLNRITIPRTLQTSPGTTKLRLFAGSFLTCLSHDWMRLLCAASVQCFVNISWIVTYEERWVLTSIENPCHIAVIQWRLLWALEIAHWKAIVWWLLKQIIAMSSVYPMTIYQSNLDSIRYIIIYRVLLDLLHSLFPAPFFFLLLHAPLIKCILIYHLLRSVYS